MTKVTKVDAYLTPTDDAVSAVRRIEGYATSDDKLFDTLEKAQKAQAYLDIAALVDRGRVGKGGEWDAGMFSNWMLENADALGYLLTRVSRSS